METKLTVKFFKRLITFTVLTIIIISVSMMIYYRTQYRNLEFEKTPADESNVSYAGNLDFEYQKKYKEMYVNRGEIKPNSTKNTVYLTFDDGPSIEITEKVLDVLKKNKIKATFFIVYKDDAESKRIIRRIIDEGHTIGIHSASHNYEKIYKSVDSYLRDFHKLDSYLKKEFDYTTRIFRFPGGSINGYNLFIYNKIIPEMYRRGYTFFDWNVASGDATNEYVSTSQIKEAVVSQVRQNNTSVVLMHDSANKETTLQALPYIIKKLKSEGYTFKPLSSNVKAITFPEDE